MSIQGPTPFPFRPLTGAATPRGAASAPASGRAARTAQAAEPAATTAPAAASESTLWDLLTPEERDFFAQQAALGSVTYRPSRAAAAAPNAPTGQRLDVRG